MPTAIPACALNGTTAAILRRKLLVTTALAPLVLALPVLTTGPAFAACTVAGTGTIGALNPGDVATCTGLGNTDHVNATGGSSVTVNVGDGTPTSLLPGAGTPAVVFDGTITRISPSRTRRPPRPTAERSCSPTDRPTTM